MSWFTQKLIEKLQECEGDDAAAAIATSWGNKFLKKSSQEQSAKSLEECAKLAIEESKTPFILKLKSKTIEQMSWFSISSGLHIIAAPSGHGKTLWAMQVAREAAEQNYETMFLSLEMTHQDLGARILADLSGLPLSQIAANDLNENQRKILTSIIESTEFLKRITIDKFNSLDWVKIKPRLIDLMIRRKPQLVVVDFVQMIYDSEGDDIRLSIQLANIARDLKLFADENECAVLLLSQMNRGVFKEIKSEKWEGAVPLQNSFIRESGGIVEAADSVTLVCIPERFDNCPEDLVGFFQVKVDKNRKFGELGTSLIPFDLKTGRFGP